MVPLSTKDISVMNTPEGVVTEEGFEPPRRVSFTEWTSPVVGKGIEPS